MRRLPLTAKARAQKRRELNNRLDAMLHHWRHSTPDGFPRAHCIVCYEGFFVEKPFHCMGLCDDCARKAGAAWYRSSCGFSQPELDPEACAKEAEAARIRNAGKYKKKTITTSLRLRVFERDLYRCVHCGTHEHLRADHIQPERLGGTLQMENLQTLCRNCNSKKGWRPKKVEAL